MIPVVKTTNYNLTSVLFPAMTHRVRAHLVVQAFVTDIISIDGYKSN